jgi:hypothetical protein
MAAWQHGSVAAIMEGWDAPILGDSDSVFEWFFFRYRATRVNYYFRNENASFGVVFG